MFKKAQFSPETPREEIIKSIKEDGFDPILISDSPGAKYNTHQHPETKLLVCLSGSMKVRVEETEYDFEAGDKLVIPGNTPHSGLVGLEGCQFFWSEKNI